MLRLGITTRKMEDPDYGEVRDALSRDWHDFFRDVMPDGKWLSIPSLGEDTADYVEGWGVNAIILSGGPDIGVDPVRDKSEQQLLLYALEKGVPILGVCRGLQLMISYFDGRLADKTDSAHVATRHPVLSVENEVGFPSGASVTVNSYHRNLVADAGKLSPFAYDDDGYIEGAYLKGSRCVGVMWHPEREQPINQTDRLLFRQLFCGEE